MKIRTVMIVLAALMLVSAQAFGQAVVFDSTNTGARPAGAIDSIKTGVVCTLFIRYNNNTANAITGFSNGIKVYSTDGAQWAASSIDTLSNASALGWGKTQFDGGIFKSTFSVDGALEDTVGLGGFSLFGSGAAAGYNNVGFVVKIGPIPTGSANHNKHVCIDSSWYPPGGDWTWSDLNGGVLPTWSGSKCFTIWDEGTGVDDGVLKPDVFSLAQNYPNPFNPTTTISYSLAEKSHVELSVYNVLGQKIRTLVNEEQPANAYEAVWDGTSADGRPVSSGVYFYRLETEKFTSTKKMMLVK